MSVTKKARAKAEELKGKVKKIAGRAAGNRRVESEGKAEQAMGDLKQAGEKVKDVFKK
ncbi:MAG: CsbD family protein [Actinomycetia bacterium]|jgi:uncharacterized protein YjbJ (UPF0337 family)|nr:CsbD family protein [Actinomycetes bacterium]